MSDNLEGICEARPVNIGRLRGGARAALAGSIFGAFWIIEGAYWGGMIGTLPLLVLALCAIAFIAWPISRLRSLGRSKIERRIGLSGAFWADVAVECLACIGAVVWLTHIRRLDLIPEWFGVIIGLHCFPIAKIFARPIYYATGSVMVLGALAVLGSLSAMSETSSHTA
jgi:hypothetical protein